jgi:hypothetical protein
VEHRPAVPLVQADRAVLSAALTVAIGALLLNVLDLDVPGRALLAVVSLLTVPGIPLVLALPIRNFQVQIVLGIALSLAFALIVSTTQLQAGLWSPLATQLILLVIGLTAAAFASRTMVPR